MTLQFFRYSKFEKGELKFVKREADADKVLGIVDGDEYELRKENDIRPQWITYDEA